MKLAKTFKPGLKQMNVIYPSWEMVLTVDIGKGPQKISCPSCGKESSIDP